MHSLCKEGVIRHRAQELTFSSKAGVKVFVCSRSDMKHERKVLFEKIYPRVRQYCRANYLTDFQLLEFKSEVMLGDSEGNNALSKFFTRQQHKMILHECFQTSAGPSFLALMGQKLGSGSLPTSVLEDDFQEIVSSLKEHKGRSSRGWEIIEFAYEYDANSCPACYVLNLPNEDIEIKGGGYTISFKLSTPESQQKLLDMFLLGINLVSENSGNDLAHYLFSDLEFGLSTALKESQDPLKDMIIFKRTIEDIQNFSNFPTFPLLFDVPQETFNYELEVRQTQLKEKIASAVKENILDLSVLWRGPDGIDPEQHQEYLQKFEEVLYDKLICTLRRSLCTPNTLPRRQQTTRNDRQRVAAMALSCSGRDDLLREIGEKIFSQSNQVRQLILHGEVGCGSSTIMASLIHQIDVSRQNEPVVLIQFIETATDGTNVQRELLGQLSAILDQKLDEKHESFMSLMGNLLSNLNHKVYLFIDNVHLISDSPAFLMAFSSIGNLCVVSTSSSQFATEMEKLDLERFCSVQVPLLAVGDCIQIMNKRLDTTPSAVLLSKVSECFSDKLTSPLSVVTALCIGDLSFLPHIAGESVRSVFKLLLHQLERNFGSQVEQTLQLLACSPLSMLELDDLSDMNIDTLLLIRLISPILLRSEQDGVTYFQFSNQIFGEIVLENCNNESCYCRLVEYLSTESQPLEFRGEDGAIAPNYRKLRSLPRLLHRAGRHDEMRSRLLAELDWIRAKIVHLSLDELLLDYSYDKCNVESQLVQSALIASRGFIADSLPSLAAQLVGRLLPHVGQRPLVCHLVRQCYHLAARHNGLMPCLPFKEVEGSHLLFEISLSYKADNLFLLDSPRRILCKANDSIFVEIFDGNTGLLLKTVATSLGYLYLSSCQRFLLIADDSLEKTVKIHDSESGHLQGQIILKSILHLQHRDRLELTAISLYESLFTILVYTSDGSSVLVVSWEKCSLVGVLNLSGRASLAVVSPDMNLLVSNIKNNLTIFSLEDMKKKSDFVLDNLPRKLIFSRKCDKAFLLCENEQQFSCLQLDNSQVTFIYKIQVNEFFGGDIIKDIALANNQKFLLVQGRENVIVYNIQNSQIFCKIQKPNQYPSTMSLPMEPMPRHLCFVDGSISSNCDYLVLGFLREVFVWDVDADKRTARIETQLGIIRKMLTLGNMILTTSVNSQVVQVWNFVPNSSNHSVLPDHLAFPVKQIRVTKNGKIAVLLYEGSDVVAAVDLKSGVITDLLKHDSPVLKLDISMLGRFVFTTTKSARSGDLVNYIWELEKRKLLKKFGNFEAHMLPMKNESDKMICIWQPSDDPSGPFEMHETVCSDLLTMTAIPCRLRHLLHGPFLTKDDLYVVALAADGYDHRTAAYDNPHIVCHEKRNFWRAKRYSYADLRLPDARARVVADVLAVKPHPGNPYAVVVFYRAGPPDSAECHSFLALDVKGGIVYQHVDQLLHPDSPVERVLCSRALDFCIDGDGNEYDLQNGAFVRRIPPADGAVPAELLLLFANDSIVVYVGGDRIFVVREANGAEVARLRLHERVTALIGCPDRETLVIGCRDGMLLAFKVAMADSGSQADRLEKFADKLLTEQIAVAENVPRRRWDQALPTPIGTLQLQPPHPALKEIEDLKGLSVDRQTASNSQSCSIQ